MFVGQCEHHIFETAEIGQRTYEVSYGWVGPASRVLAYQSRTRAQRELRMTASVVSNPLRGVRVVASSWAGCLRCFSRTRNCVSGRGYGTTGEVARQVTSTGAVYWSDTATRFVNVAGCAAPSVSLCAYHLSAVRKGRKIKSAVELAKNDRHGFVWELYRAPGREIGLLPDWQICCASVRTPSRDRSPILDRRAERHGTLH